MFDPSTPDAFWLDITNAALGLFCLACLIAFGWTIYRDVRDKQRERAADRAQSQMHVLHSQELGLTMADGGRPLEDDDSDTPRSR